ncbi:MAG: rhodanese-like domain-containing protein [Chloroflexi bacterium]|nr:rhodanese-like domain-containing protein [Chloroflexota bacterium]
MTMTSSRWVIAVLTALFTFATGCSLLSKPAAGGYATIPPQELQARMDTGEKLVIVDLREPELFRAGHIPGARNIPFEQFDARMNELKPDDDIVLVCHVGQMGDVSGSLLAERGYPKVANLAGGMTRWDGKLEK